MSNSAKQRTAASSAASAPSSNPARPAADNLKTKKAEPSSKQSRVIAMLQSSSGTTIAAMMKVTGWQQHSVRGFLAGVVRKRLKLKLCSKKVDGNRVYQITRGSGSKSAKKSARPSRTESHSTSRLRACVISTSVSFGSGGKMRSGGGV